MNMTLNMRVKRKEKIMLVVLITLITSVIMEIATIMGVALIDECQNYNLHIDKVIPDS